MQTNSGKYVHLMQIVEDRRKIKRITQAAMAKELGTTKRTYQRWEVGDVSLSQLQSILEKLDLKLIILPKELIEYPGTQKNTT